MNDRIKELMEEAGYLEDMFGVGHWDMPECKKFTELLVKECALLCISRPSPGDDVRSREHCREQILEHFGIEE